MIWLTRQIKWVFFWIYLWQLKEYHTGRFLAHFQTDQGKKLLFHPLSFVKVLLLLDFVGVLAVRMFQEELLSQNNTVFVLVLVAFGVGIFATFLLYTVEAIKAVLDSMRKRLKMPVFTKKTLVLVILGVGAQIAFYGVLTFTDVSVSTFFLGREVFVFTASSVFSGLLLFDLLTPFVVSGIVLGFQPFAVMGRNRILSKAKERRAKMKNLKVIGITGSYGKTSTKEFLAHILGQKYQVLKTPEHANSEVGIARTILRNLTDEHDVFVCEMGAYNKGGIKLLAEIAKPQIGIVTGANEQHLATFGSMENLLSAEGGAELVKALPRGGIAILNGASPKLKEHLARLKRAGEGVKFIVATEDIRAGDVRVEKERLSFRIEGVTFAVPAYGAHNVQNLLLAIAAARALGMGLKEIAKALESMPLELSALKVKKVASGATVIDSTYSANPDGVIADLEYLNLYEGKKILVMPCLIELGKASQEAHRKIGEKIAQVCDLAIITTGECLASVKEGAAGQSDKIFYMGNAQYIFDKIKEIVEERGAILLEGGKESRTQLQLLALLNKND
ncbi:MAG: hypothetical protein A3J30_02220 [Candidatus Wildermuthbacteria bacterium RIFCSPLOWO2_02_FULL_47_9c]|uniref:UDP-N-acetylmuramoyl-tripeptide-D-alanyl-D-alanine ligase n=2 Tax=Parcubacteria group TaxID=1794811 RepID=A0A837ILC4_9BACT|nr:MAG: UDP-N-acetylmuramoyl-tripeptide-D-alanyl-D-alanine ligase [Candidatus Yanofskybacteria bacterium GW2011_GWC1_48_11]KKW04737.1 MAG: UDP-N-acetylmuramoyl-tripeptide-D-alanyl-D-alanine ligase [Parcubacteria group bacterium GW2011_GWB1_49_12]KKW08962.1 MAG: UDP-N-acetylmuramoyl-tripeptide-D-alanyl-D-alanine ligase [Parcubacteria group bacterium GW2011_GWA1_49_26]KKW14269.1 MAG: UDP-N-acetylmuramoyl-tripeptide-D-alanyl-D-alanine ligase [Parcubacteria group bacterium GW2011_GWA2_50_10]OHA6101